MADSLTSNLNLVKPENGQSNNTWGTKTNGNWDILDAAVAALQSAVTAAVLPGTIMFYPAATLPAGWLKANGAAVSRTTYAALFAIIGTTFGVGNGSSTFNVPDLRGEFIRGFDDGRGVDTGRVLGSLQSEAFLAHTHTGTVNSDGAHTHTGTTASDGAHTHTGTTASDGAHTHTLSIASDGAHTHTVALQANSTTGGGASPGTTPSGGPINTGSAGAHSHAGSTAASSGAHTHTFTTGSGGAHTHTFTTGSGGAHTHTFTSGSAGGAETRPRNVALLALIKY